MRRTDGPSTKEPIMIACRECAFVARNIGEMAQHARDIHEDGFPYKCHLCTRSYRKSSGLVYHSKIHSSSGPSENDIYVCIEKGCGFRTTGSNKLTRHYKLVHNHESPYKCTICHNSYKQLLSLKLHWKKNHNGEVVVMFPDSMNSEDSLKDIIVKEPMTSDDDNTIVGDVYEELYGQDEMGYYKNLVIESDENSKFMTKDEYIKEDTPEEFISEVNDEGQELPIEVLETRDPLYCYGSEKATPKLNVAGTAKNATGEENLPMLKEPIAMACKECTFIACNIRQMAQHVKHVHDDQFPYKCPRCNKAYRKSSGLFYHIKIHGPSESTENNAYQCIEPGCGFATDGSNKLTRHYKLVHSQEDPYRCNVCGAGYKRLLSLKLHKKKHEAAGINVGAKGVVFDPATGKFPEVKLSLLKEPSPMLCGVCNFIACNIRQMAQHSKHVHNDKFPYKCPRCARSYRKSSGLFYHYKIHGPSRHSHEDSRNNKYVCVEQDCGFTTDGANKLTRHYKYVHNHAKPYRCNKCHASYKRLLGLKAHLLKHHKTTKRTISSSESDDAISDADVKPEAMVSDIVVNYEIPKEFIWPDSTDGVEKPQADIVPQIVVNYEIPQEFISIDTGASNVAAKGIIITETIVSEEAAKALLNPVQIATNTNQVTISRTTYVEPSSPSSVVVSGNVDDTAARSDLRPEIVVSYETPEEYILSSKNEENDNTQVVIKTEPIENVETVTKMTTRLKAKNDATKSKLGTNAMIPNEPTEEIPLTDSVNKAPHKDYILLKTVNDNALTNGCHMGDSLVPENNKEIDLPEIISDYEISNQFILLETVDSEGKIVSLL